MKHKKIVKWIVYCLIILMAMGAYAQEQDLSEQDLSQVKNFEKIKVDRLKRIRKELVGLESEIYTLKNQIKEEIDMVARLKMEGKLLQLETDFDKKRNLFIETATNISLDWSDDKSLPKKVDFLEQLQQILEPALHSIKKISERPRQIQKHKEEINLINDRLESSKKALKKLEDLFKEKEHKELSRTLKKSIKKINTIIKELSIKVEDHQFKLLKLQKNKGSIVTSISNLIFNFFKTKGKNLFFALVTFLLFFWGFRLGKNRFIKLFMFRIKKRNQHPEQVHWIARPLRIIYMVLTTILSLFMGILVLYALNDWVLVTFIIIVLGALVWSSKHYIPVFLEQSKIILNLGAIREGERIIYNNLAWEIKGLGYYCRLHNPVLTGGRLRINTRELLTYNSRPINGNEPWFPTDQGDWVELSDGTFGKVTLQSPEQVAIKLIGGESKFLGTQDFLALNPVNLSRGFCIDLIFGFDYSHQGIILEEILPEVKTQVREQLAARYPQDKAGFKELTVEFYQAGASSLDIRIFLRIDGKLASKKLELKRKMQSILVETCNKNNYIIPFNQLTVHMAKENNDKLQ